MSKKQMQIVSLPLDTNCKQLMLDIGVSAQGVDIMQKKANSYLFKITNLSIKAANILKQDALSCGGDLGVSANCSRMSCEYTDALLIIDQRKLERLIEKLKLQPFGLKECAFALKAFLPQKIYPPKLMAVLNINSDSFYENSRVCENTVLTRAKQAFQNGADILDIGAVSSRPGSVYPGINIEMKHIIPVIDIMQGNGLSDKISIDSFCPQVIEYALKSGIKIINDITGLANDDVGRLVGAYDATLIIMHKLGDTTSMQANPLYDNVIDEIVCFFERQITKALSLGVTNIILDPGIGFGKNLSHNLEIIRCVKNFTKFGYEVLIGASRKSLIDKISPSDVKERLGGTLALHLAALEGGASIIRAHDVFEHRQAIDVWRALKNRI